MDFVKNKASQIFRSANTTTKRLDDAVHLQVGQTVWPATPRHMRTEMWLSVLHRRSGSGLEAKNRYYEYLARDVPPLVLEEIRKDIARTFPDLDIFSDEVVKQQFANVLRAYAAYDPEVGYCQGMNFLAGMLMAYIPSEPDAFGLLVILLRDRNLRELYKPDMSMLQARLWQIGRLMPQVLAIHLESHGTLPVLYASSWLMTCFASDFPIPFSSRIVDVVLCGSYAEPLMKVVVAILRKVKRRLLDVEDMEEMVEYLKQTIPNWPLEDLQKLLTDALGMQWTMSERQVLAEVEGAETVLDAVRRVKAYEEGPSQDNVANLKDSDNTDEWTVAINSSNSCSSRQSGLPETKLRTKPIMTSTASQLRGVVPKLEPPKSLSSRVRSSTTQSTDASSDLWKSAMVRRSLPATQVSKLIDEAQITARATKSDTHELNSNHSESAILPKHFSIRTAAPSAAKQLAESATNKSNEPPNVETPHLLDMPLDELDSPANGFDSWLDMPLSTVDVSIDSPTVPYPLPTTTDSPRLTSKDALSHTRTDSMFDWADIGHSPTSTEVGPFTPKRSNLSVNSEPALVNAPIVNQTAALTSVSTVIATASSSARPMSAPTPNHARVATRDFSEFKSATPTQSASQRTSTPRKMSRHYRVPTGDWNDFESAPAPLPLESTMDGASNDLETDSGDESLEDYLSMIPTNPVHASTGTTDMRTEASQRSPIPSPHQRAAGESCGTRPQAALAPPLDLLSLEPTPLSPSASPVALQQPVQSATTVPPFFDHSTSAPALAKLDSSFSNLSAHASMATPKQPTVVRRTLPSYSGRRSAGSDQLPFGSTNELSMDGLSRLRSLSADGGSSMDSFSLNVANRGGSQGSLKSRKIDDWAAVQTQELNAFVQLNTTIT